MIPICFQRTDRGFNQTEDVIIIIIIPNPSLSLTGKYVVISESVKLLIGSQKFKR